MPVFASYVVSQSHLNVIYKNNRSDARFNQSVRVHRVLFRSILFNVVSTIPDHYSGPFRLFFGNCHFCLSAEAYLLHCIGTWVICIFTASYR